MSKTFMLVKTMLKMQYAKTDSSKSYVWLYVLLAVFLLPVGYLYLQVASQITHLLHGTLAPLQQEAIILGLLLLLVHVVLFFTSIFTVINAFYFADDIEKYIPLPLHPYQLLIGKSASPFMYLYALNAVIFLPIFFFYGQASGSGILYYLFGLLIFILMPLIPFTLASILVMFVMRFVNIAKNKDRSKVIAGTASFAVIILINVLVRLNTDQEAIMSNLALFLTEQNGLLKQVSFFYPPAYFSALLLHEPVTVHAIWRLAVILLMHGAAILGFLFFAQTFYMKGMMGLGSGSKKTYTSASISHSITTRSSFRTLVLKELKTIIRTPTFLMQCVIQSLFAPVFIIVLFFMDFGVNTDANIAAIIGGKELLLLLIIATTVFISSNMTAPSSFSRDGRNWSTYLYLPVTIKDILLSKVTTAWIINMLTIVFLLIFTIWLDIGWVVLFCWLVIAIMANAFISMVGLYFDLKQPKMNWTDEQEVFKGRMIGFVSLLAIVGIIGGISFIIWIVPWLEGLLVTSLVFIMIFLLLNIVMWKMIRKKASREYLQKM